MALFKKLKKMREAKAAEEQEKKLAAE